MTRDPYAGWAIKALAVVMVLYVTLHVLPLIPQQSPYDLLVTGLALAFLAIWVPFPYWLHVDRRRVAEATDYTPSTLYYLGWLPGPVGLSILLVYIHRRMRAYGRLETSSGTVEEA